MRKSAGLFRRSLFVFFRLFVHVGGGDPGVAAAAGVAAVGGGGSILGSVPLCYSEAVLQAEKARRTFFFWVLVL